LLPLLCSRKEHLEASFCRCKQPCLYNGILLTKVVLLKLNKQTSSVPSDMAFTIPFQREKNEKVTYYIISWKVMSFIGF